MPRIGGKALDLHRLFVEVTSRGGLEKVMKTDDIYFINGKFFLRLRDVLSVQEFLFIKTYDFFCSCLHLFFV